MHLYVYYDVPREASTRARAGIRAMQQKLADACGSRGRLLHRFEEGKSHETWMEIYEHVDDAFEAKLEAAFAQCDVREVLTGPRHIERFADFD